MSHEEERLGKEESPGAPRPSSNIDAHNTNIHYAQKKSILLGFRGFCQLKMI